MSGAPPRAGRFSDSVSMWGFCRPYCNEFLLLSRLPLDFISTHTTLAVFQQPQLYSERTRLLSRRIFQFSGLSLLFSGTGDFYRTLVTTFCGRLNFPTRSDYFSRYSEFFRSATVLFWWDVVVIALLRHLTEVSAFQYLFFGKFLATTTYYKDGLGWCKKSDNFIVWL